MIIGSSTATDTVDPNSQAAGSQKKLDEDLNRFLNLLITQLKNQDPLDPLDATEFTSQLVQFASVEQQIAQNANLEKMLNLQQTSQVASMVDFIGTTVEFTGDRLPLTNGAAEFTYTLGTNVVDNTIAIRNSSGLTVFTTEGQTGAGEHTFKWDGKDANGIQQPDGAYTLTVAPIDATGKIANVTTTAFGQVTGAGAEDGVVSLFMGDDVTITMDQVLSVKETKQPAP